MNRRGPDPFLLFTVLFLVGLGVVMVASSSWTIGAANNGSEHHYALRQAVFASVGVVLMTVTACIRLEIWRRLAYPLLVVTGILLVVVLIPGVGVSAGVARRWIALGPITLQAGELAKVSLIVYLAMSLAKKGQRVRSFAVGVVPHAIVTIVLVGLILLEPDFGTAALIIVIAGAMLFVAGAPLRALLAAGVLAIPTAAFLIASSAYRARRIIAFLDPWGHRYDVGYQVTESLMAIGSGGAFGLGLGEGKQKLFYLPAAHTDFVFAVIGEELGLLGVVVVVLAFAVIVVRGLSVGARSEDAFRALVSTGCAVALGVQAVVNMFVVLGLVPTKGLPLPFVSYGGSSLLVSCIMAGLLLRAAAEQGAMENIPVMRRRPA